MGCVYNISIPNSIINYARWRTIICVAKSQFRTKCFYREMYVEKFALFKKRLPISFHTKICSIVTDMPSEI